MHALSRWAVTILLFSAITASAAWTEQQSHIEPSIASGVVHRHLLMRESADGTDVTVDLAKFSPRIAALRVIDNPGGRDLAAAMEGSASVAGVNGGYFDENFRPLGLRIDSGKTSSNLVRARLMTGVIAGADSFVRILRANEFGKNNRPTTALQCGPFLVDRGQRMSGLNGSRSARRTFVAVTQNNDVALGVCSDVSLQQLSTLLVDLPDLRIQRALNLDGGSSTAFWFKRKDGSILSISEQKNVRDFVGVEAK